MRDVILSQGLLDENLIELSTNKHIFPKEEFLHTSEGIVLVTGNEIKTFSCDLCDAKSAKG